MLRVRKPQFSARNVALGDSRGCLKMRQPLVIMADGRNDLRDAHDFSLRSMICTGGAAPQISCNLAFLPFKGKTGGRSAKPTCPLLAGLDFSYYLLGRSARLALLSDHDGLIVSHLVMVYHMGDGIVMYHMGHSVMVYHLGLSGMVNGVGLGRVLDCF